MLDTLDPCWSNSSAGCDFTGAQQVVEKRTTVKDLLKMKRQLCNPYGVFWKQKQLQEGDAMVHEVRRCDRQTSEHMDNQNLAEDPPAPSHHNPEHIDHVSFVRPSTAPRTPSTQRMDLSPSQPCSNPPTPHPILHCQLQSTPPDYCTSLLTSSITSPADLNLPEPPCSSLGAPNFAYSQQWNCAGRPITNLFQWQVQQQLDKMKNVSPEVINRQDSDGDTPLHIAVAQGKRALAFVLAANMALSGTLDLPEHNGQTALHIAAATDQPLMVGDLVEYGAKVHRRDIWGRSPLHVCVEKAHVRSLHSMFTTLKATGKDFDVDLVNYEGLTPLHIAVLAHNTILREESALELSASVKERELLLKKGINFIECVKALLKMGAYCGAIVGITLNKSNQQKRST